MATPDTGIDWPAWVQAVGSVVALAMTGGLAVWEAKQRRRDESLRRADEARQMAEQLVARVAILSFAVDQVDVYIGAQKGNERTRYVKAAGYSRALANFLKQAETVSARDMPTKACVDRYFVLQAGLQNIGRLLSSYEDSWLNEEEIARLEGVSKPLRPAIDMLLQLAEAYKSGKIK